MDDEGRRYREKWEQGAATAIRDFDKIVATISAGALGISITFLDRIAQDPMTHAGRLEWGWALLTTSLVTSMLSFLTSERSYRWLIKQQNEDVPLGELKDRFWGPLTDVLNVVAALGVAAGVLLVGYFALGNL